VEEETRTFVFHFLFNCGGGGGDMSRAVAHLHTASNFFIPPIFFSSLTFPHILLLLSFFYPFSPIFFPPPTFSSHFFLVGLRSSVSLATHKQHISNTYFRIDELSFVAASSVFFPPSFLIFFSFFFHRLELSFAASSLYVPADVSRPCTYILHVWQQWRGLCRYGRFRL
jgi:hypothetical protein